MNRVSSIGVFFVVLVLLFVSTGISAQGMMPAKMGARAKHDPQTVPSPELAREPE